MANADVLKALAATAALYGREVGPDAAQMLADDLEGHAPEKLIAALARCRRELRTFPTVADILSRIDDGRPGIEAAWALIPQGEDDTAVWTTEVRDAFSQVRHLVAEDPVAGRMAFREIYTKLLLEARDQKAAPVWEVTLGHDKRKREAVLSQAVALGRLTQERANALLPYLPAPTGAVQITGATEPKQINPAEMLAEIRARIAGNGAEHG